jgi:hypothetical protein
MPAGRPLKFKSVAELEEKINTYFAKMDKEKRPYTVTGLAVALKCDRDTLLNYEKKAEYFGTIKEAKQKIHNYAEEQLFIGKNPAGVMFNMMNNWDWRDKRNTDHSGEVNINQVGFAERLLKAKKRASE